METRPRTATFLAGLLLTGYGILVTLRVLAHEAFGLGILLLVGGGSLLFAARPPSTAARSLRNPPTRGQVVATALLGSLAAGGILLYNLWTRSTLTPWEIGILVYGAALLAIAPRLDRPVGPTDTGTLVAWSFPVVAAPLGVFALDAALKGQSGASPLDPFLVYGLVAPMAWSLGLVGFDVDTIGQTVLMQTPRGSLSLGIGLVCAGFQPGILFLGVLGLHAWRMRTPPGRLVAYLAVGLLGVYTANLVRLVALALVGYEWGGQALQTAHAHLGWILFFGWIMLFWWIVLRKIEGAPRPDRTTTPAP